MPLCQSDDLLRNHTAAVTSRRVAVVTCAHAIHEQRTPLASSMANHVAHSSRLAGAPTTFSAGFFCHRVLQRGLTPQPLQVSALRFKFLQALGIRHVHVARLATPERITVLREAVPTAQLGNC